MFQFWASYIFRLTEASEYLKPQSGQSTIGHPQPIQLDSYAKLAPVNRGVRIKL